ALQPARARERGSARSLRPCARDRGAGPGPEGSAPRAGADDRDLAGSDPLSDAVGGETRGFRLRRPSFHRRQARRFRQGLGRKVGRQPALDHRLPGHLQQHLALSAIEHAHTRPPQVTDLAIAGVVASVRVSSALFSVASASAGLSTMRNSARSWAAIMPCWTRAWKFTTSFQNLEP